MCLSSIFFSLLTSFLHSAIFTWILLFHQYLFRFSLLLFFFILPSFSATTYAPAYNKLFISVMQLVMILWITLLTSSTVSFSSFSFTFLSDGNWVFSDINITSLSLFSTFFSSSFSNLISFACQQTSRHLFTDTQTSATSTRCCSS